jgi:hypothetical protein
MIHGKFRPVPELFLLITLISLFLKNLFMKSRKILKRTFFAVLLILIVAFVWLAFNVFPAISGYGSKNLCSAVYLQHRDPARVIKRPG